jgi:hypothetical protein
MGTSFVYGGALSSEAAGSGDSESPGVHLEGMKNNVC